MRPNLNDSASDNRKANQKSKKLQNTLPVKRPDLSRYALG